MDGGDKTEDRIVADLSLAGANERFEIPTFSVACKKSVYTFIHSCIYIYMNTSRPTYVELEVVVAAG